MGTSGIRNVCKVDLNKPPAEQSNLHVSRIDYTVGLGIPLLTNTRENRWHPDIPSAGAIKDGETVKIECLDWWALLGLSSPTQL